MLWTFFKETAVQSGWCEWLLVFHYNHLPQWTTKHRAITINVITVTSPCTLLACDTRNSFTFNCTQSHFLFFQCCSCSVSLCLKWTIIHCENMPNALSSQWCYGNNAAAVRLYMEKYPQCRFLNHWSSYQGDHYCTHFYGRPWKVEKCTNSWCGWEHRRIPIVVFVGYKLLNMWCARQCTGPPMNSCSAGTIWIGYKL
jgi:hypothetical protein